MNMDDFRDDLTPGQVLAREMRNSRRATERTEKSIAEAEQLIAGCRADIKAQLERQAALQAAMDRLAYAPAET